MEEQFKAAKKLIDDAHVIVILQADNPDGDSLASALALEAILADMGKEPIMVCGIDMPAHLRYLSGWDRVEKEVPQKFDASIIVDTSTLSLFESLDKNGQMGWVKSKPVLVLDHHVTSDGIDYAQVSIVDQAVSTGEVIYSMATSQSMPLSIDAMNFIAVSIMSDSLGLTSEGTTVRAIRIIADVVENGVSLAELDAARRELMKREPELLPYKGKLLQRVELHDEGRIASIMIPWDEIERFSSIYNPSMLAIDDMRMTVGVKVCIAFKVYNNGRVTAKIRCNPDGQIADKLAAEFGGGGHPYAAGFKVLKTDDFAKLKSDTIKRASELLKELA